MIVVDSSVFIDSMLGKVDLPDDEWIAPAGIDLEVLHVWRRHARTTVGAAAAREGLDHFAELQFERYPVEPLLPRIWAFRHDMTAYDAAYVAVAESLGHPLLTFDRRLATTASRYCEVLTT